MQNRIISKISHSEIKAGEAVKGSEIRQGVFDLIVAQYPDFTGDDSISIYELNSFRRLYLTKIIKQEHGELAQVDRDVIKAIQDNAILSENIQDEIENQLTIGQRLADQIATFGGSWGFNYNSQ